MTDTLNGTRLYPTEPDLNVFTVARVTVMSGEIVITYYITTSAEIFKITDWTGDKPEPSTLSALCRITGDTENMIRSRYQQWRRDKKLIGDLSI